MPSHRVRENTIVHVRDNPSNKQESIAYCCWEGVDLSEQPYLEDHQERTRKTSEAENPDQRIAEEPHAKYLLKEGLFDVEDDMHLW